MTDKKRYLKEKLIEFQKNIADLKHELIRQEDRFRQREHDHYIQLFEILDAFENIEANLESKRDMLDKTGKMMGRNIRSIHKKTRRILESSHIVPMEFQDNKAEISLCKVVETRAEPGVDDETIISVLKKGYIDTRDGSVLRKAEVVTVLNQ
ncbi:MAG: nucleotide exchange factor GrpE [Desulfamplus sp.]|nr:nucleotide exchange factor GrpE [Desulfamplus sp.]